MTAPAGRAAMVVKELWNWDRITPLLGVLQRRVSALALMAIVPPSRFAFWLGGAAAKSENQGFPPSVERAICGFVSPVSSPTRTMLLGLFPAKSIPVVVP